MPLLSCKGAGVLAKRHHTELASDYCDPSRLPLDHTAVPLIIFGQCRSVHAQLLDPTGFHVTV